MVRGERPLSVAAGDARMISACSHGNRSVPPPLVRHLSWGAAEGGWSEAGPGRPRHSRAHSAHSKPSSTRGGVTRPSISRVDECRPSSAGVGECRHSCAREGDSRPFSARVGECRPSSARSRGLEMDCFPRLNSGRRAGSKTAPLATAETGAASDSGKSAVAAENQLDGDAGHTSRGDTERTDSESAVVQENGTPASSQSVDSPATAQSRTEPLAEPLVGCVTGPTSSSSGDILQIGPRDPSPPERSDSRVSDREIEASPSPPPAEEAPHRNYFSSAWAWRRLLRGVTRLLPGRTTPRRYRPNKRDLSAREMTMGEEERLRLLLLVKQGQLSIDQAINVVRQYEESKRRGEERRLSDCLPQAAEVKVPLAPKLSRFSPLRLMRRLSAIRGNRRKQFLRDLAFYYREQEKRRAEQRLAALTLADYTPPTCCLTDNCRHDNPGSPSNACQSNARHNNACYSSASRGNTRHSNIDQGSNTHDNRGLHHGNSHLDNRGRDSARHGNYRAENVPTVGGLQAEWGPHGWSGTHQPVCLFSVAPSSFTPSHSTGHTTQHPWMYNPHNALVDDPRWYNARVSDIACQCAQCIGPSACGWPVYLLRSHSDAAHPVPSPAPPMGLQRHSTLRHSFHGVPVAYRRYFTPDAFPDAYPDTLLVGARPPSLYSRFVPILEEQLSPSASLSTSDLLSQGELLSPDALSAADVRHAAHDARQTVHSPQPHCSHVPPRHRRAGSASSQNRKVESDRSRRFSDLPPQLDAHRMSASDSWRGLSGDDSSVQELAELDWGSLPRRHAHRHTHAAHTPTRNHTHAAHTPTCSLSFTHQPPTHIGLWQTKQPETHRQDHMTRHSVCEPGSRSQSVTSGIMTSAVSSEQVVEGEREVRGPTPSVRPRHRCRRHSQVKDEVKVDVRHAVKDPANCKDRHSVKQEVKDDVKVNGQGQGNVSEHNQIKDNSEAGRGEALGSREARLSGGSERVAIVTGSVTPVGGAVGWRGSEEASSSSGGTASSSSTSGCGASIRSGGGGGASRTPPGGPYSSRYSGRGAGLPASVHELCARLNIQHLLGLFLSNGFETLDLFSQLEACDLDALGVSVVTDRATVLAAARLMGNPTGVTETSWYSAESDTGSTVEAGDWSHTVTPGEEGSDDWSHTVTPGEEGSHDWSRDDSDYPVPTEGIDDFDYPVTLTNDERKSGDWAVTGDRPIFVTTTAQIHTEPGASFPLPGD